MPVTSSSKVFSAFCAAATRLLCARSRRRGEQQGEAAGSPPMRPPPRRRCARSGQSMSTRRLHCFQCAEASALARSGDASSWPSIISTMSSVGGAPLRAASASAVSSRPWTRAATRPRGSSVAGADQDPAPAVALGQDGAATRVALFTRRRSSPARTCRASPCRRRRPPAGRPAWPREVRHVAEIDAEHFAPGLGGDDPAVVRRRAGAGPGSFEMASSSASSARWGRHTVVADAIELGADLGDVAPHDLDDVELLLGACAARPARGWGTAASPRPRYSSAVSAANRRRSAARSVASPPRLRATRASPGFLVGRERGRAEVSSFHRRTGGGDSVVERPVASRSWMASSTAPFRCPSPWDSAIQNVATPANMPSSGARGRRRWECCGSGTRRWPMWLAGRVVVVAGDVDQSLGVDHVLHLLLEPLAPVDQLRPHGQRPPVLASRTASGGRRRDRRAATAASGRAREGCEDREHSRSPCSRSILASVRTCFSFRSARADRERAAVRRPEHHQPAAAAGPVGIVHRRPRLGKCVRSGGDQPAHRMGDEVHRLAVPTP